MLFQKGACSQFRNRKSGMEVLALASLVDALQVARYQTGISNCASTSMILRKFFLFVLTRSLAAGVQGPAPASLFNQINVN